nr:hypothetical protein [Tanacetum cinerariifolium]
MVKLSFDLNVRKDSSDTDEATQNDKNMVHFGVYLKFLLFIKEVEVDVDNESEEESDTKENDNSSSDSEDLDYDSKHDEVFDDDEHIVEDVH